MVGDLRGTFSDSQRGGVQMRPRAPAAIHHDIVGYLHVHALNARHTKCQALPRKRSGRGQITRIAQIRTVSFRSV